MEHSKIYDMAEQEVSQSETGLSFELQNLISISKSDIKEKVNAVVTTIQSGWTDPVDALIFAKKGVELFTSLEKNVREYAEAKPIGKDFSKHGTKITEGMNGVKYDYSVCGDLIWNKLSKEKESIADALKKREQFLKSIPSKTIIGDSDTGESWEVIPPLSSGKLGFKLEIQ